MWYYNLFYTASSIRCILLCIGWNLHGATDSGHLLIDKRLPFLIITFLLHRTDAHWLIRWESPENKHFSTICKQNKLQIALWSGEWFLGIFCKHSSSWLVILIDLSNHRTLLIAYNHIYRYYWEWTARQYNVSYSWNCMWVVRESRIRTFWSSVYRMTVQWRWMQKDCTHPTYYAQRHPRNFFLIVSSSDKKVLFLIWTILRTSTKFLLNFLFLW